MEKTNRKKKLLFAFILGFCWFTVLCIYLFNGIKLVNETQQIWGQVEETVLNEYLEDFGGTVRDVNEGLIREEKIRIVITAMLSIISILAILLNIFGWLKNGSKKILIAGILYLIGLNIPSAVLCFIGYRQLKQTEESTD